MRAALAAVVALAARGAATGAGITASLTSSAINTIVAGLLPALERKIGTITIPDISGNKDDFDYSMHDISCHSFTIASAAVALAPPAALAAALDGVSVACGASWSFHLHSWPHTPSGSGSADVAVSKTTAALSVALGARALRPNLTATSAALTVGAVDITLHGSAWDWLLDLFKSELESAVRGALDKSFGPAIVSFVDVDGNAALGAIPIAVPIAVRAPYNVSEARFGFTAPPVATTTFLGIAVQGDVVPLNSTVEPPVPAPALPFDGSDASFMIEGRFSPYLLESAAWTYFSLNLTVWPIAPADIPLGLNVSDAYAIIAPGLPKAFPHATVSITVAFAAVPAMMIAPEAAGGISAAAPLTIAFAATPAAGGPPQPAFTLSVNARVALNVSVGPSPTAPGSLVFSGALRYISADIALASTAVGPVSVALLQGLVDLVLPLACTVLNSDLSRGFPLPPIAGIEFTSASSLELLNGFARLGVDFTFNPA
jgi:hypothetical protein